MTFFIYHNIYFLLYNIQIIPNDINKKIIIITSLSTKVRKLYVI